AAEFTLLGRRGVAKRDAEAATDAEIGAYRAHHSSVLIGYFDDASGNRAGGLTDRTGERTKAAVWVDHRNRPGRLLARPGHLLGPHCGDYTKICRCPNAFPPRLRS